MNTHTLSLAAAVEQFRDGLVNYSATSGHAGRSNLLVPPPLPPTGATNPGYQPNGSQPRGYPRSPAQGQVPIIPYLPCSSSSGPPPVAASTSWVSTLDRCANQDAQNGTYLASVDEGIKLERPMPPAGGTIVEVRRDACVRMRFDMVKISQSTSTEYVGLKIPHSVSVMNRENTSDDKLLGLHILVFGAASGLQYKSICDDCQKKENRPGSLSAIDFHSKSDVVLQSRSGDDRSICVSFTFHCYPRHYNSGDSEYRLEVLLCEQEQQGSPIVRYRLPYTFNVVAKRTRDQLEPQAGSNPPAPRRRNIRRKTAHDSNHVGPATSCSVRPSTHGQPSSGSSGSLGNVASSSQTNNPTYPPASVRDLVPPVLHAESSRPIRVPVPPARVEDPMDGQNAVIEGTNPGRGPTTGGIEVWIHGTNLPNGSTPLYARFGENVTRANILRSGLLSCKLPSRSSPGTVAVTLSRGPTANSPALGESLCEFEYYEHLNEAVAILVRILKVSNHEQAAALELLVKGANSSTREHREEGRSGQRGGVSDNDMERAMIQALEPLQSTVNFDKLVSMTNDYNQTLAHLAVMFRYLKLLKQLVEWGTDLTIADVNGLTPLHCAYRGGDRAFVEPLLDAGAPRNVLDVLGRTPAHLIPGEFALPIDADKAMVSDDQYELQFEAITLVESIDSRDGGQSESGDTNSVAGAEPKPNAAMQGSNSDPSTPNPAAGGPTSRVQHLLERLMRKVRRIPDVPHDPDTDATLPNHEESLADPDPIEYPCKEVLPSSKISLEALRAPISPQVEQTYIIGATQEYHGSLKKENVYLGSSTHSIMPSNDVIPKRCAKCGKTGLELGRPLKRCAGCGGDDLPVNYCNEACQIADWQNHKRKCKKLSPDANGRASRTHIASWYRVYKTLLEWAVHQASLTQSGDFDPNHPYLVVELDYFEGAPQLYVPCLHLTRLRVLPPRAKGPDPFKEKGAQVIECSLQECRIIHKCATLDYLQGGRPCKRWNYVVADMVALGFQNEEQMKKSLPLVATRHNLFEAFVGVDSPLSEGPFPPLSRSLPAELEVGPWIWIKDPMFSAWFVKETGKTVATRVAELGAQASVDKCLGLLLRWATDPESPTLEDFGMECPNDA